MSTNAPATAVARVGGISGPVGMELSKTKVIAIMWALVSSLLLLWFVPRIAVRPASAATSLGVAKGEYWKHHDERIAPKVFLIGMFDDEGDIWHGIPDFNVLERNLTVRGFSPRYPQAHCTNDGDICQLVTDEGEINAAATISSLVLSPLFNLTRTYFLIAGVAGISPKVGTIGSVTFARFGVQVALQYEFDAREKPAGFPTGYVPQGTTAPGEYPRSIYGTEVFELNDALRQLAIAYARTAELVDTAPAQAYREQYAPQAEYAPGAAPPSVIACDTATGDTWWSGDLLGAVFENTTALFTNGTGEYCTTQQEDNATLGALLRGALAGLVDFARVVVMRTASDFDRPSPGQSASANLFDGTAGYEPSLKNIPAAGVPIVNAIVAGWEARFEAGVPPTNYVGDIWGSLGGSPDFGPGSLFGGKPASVQRRRSDLPGV